jgi:endoglucanase
MSGVQTEACSDTSGGKDVDYIDPNDWMDYNINLSAAGSYTVSFRVASPASSAQLQLQTAGGTVLANVALPNTGGWQAWQTVTANVTLPAGQQTLRVVSTSPQFNGWNFNWVEFAQNATVTPLSVSPNPTSGSFLLQVNNSYTGSMDVQILDASGNVQKDFPLTKDATGSMQTYLSISDLPSGSYSLKVTMSQWSSTIPITRQ